MRTTDHSAAAGDLAAFDRSSGSLLERALFNHRGIVLVLCLLATLVLGWQSTRVQLNASFEKTIPTQHPYIVNFLANKNDIAGSGNQVRVVVETRGESIFEPAYLQTLQKVSDELYLLPGVDRPRLKSLWTPTTRWIAVTSSRSWGRPRGRRAFSAVARCW